VIVEDIQSVVAKCGGGGNESASRYGVSPRRCVGLGCRVGPWNDLFLMAPDCSSTISSFHS
jgi:hypothetical protein